MEKTHTAIVLVSRYTRNNIYNLFRNFSKDQVHYILSHFVDYPKKSAKYRVVLEPRNKDNVGNCCRLANLYELVFFAIKNPDFALQYGVIEGFDDYLDLMGKETRVSLTIPYLGYSGGRPLLSVGRNDRLTSAEYQLVVTSQRKMIK